MCDPAWVGRSRPQGSSLETAAAVAGGYVYVQEFNQLHVFQAAGCGEAGCLPVGTEIETFDSTEAVAPVVAMGSEFVPNVECFLGHCGVDVFRGSGCGLGDCPPNWMAETPGGIEASPAVADGRLFVASDKLYAFDAVGCGASTCPAQWTGGTERYIFSAPVVAGDVVFVVSSSELGLSGKVFAFDAAGCGASFCEPLWTAPAAGKTRSSPALTHGTLYLSGGDDLLVAYGVGSA